MNRLNVTAATNAYISVMGSMPWYASIDPEIDTEWSIRPHRQHVTLRSGDLAAALDALAMAMLLTRSHVDTTPVTAVPERLRERHEAAHNRLMSALAENQWP